MKTWNGILISVFGFVLALLSLNYSISSNDYSLLLGLSFWIGFLLIFVGPFYFWYLEPIRSRL